MIDTNSLKQAVARAALEYVAPDTIIGVGTGSTANAFIDLLGQQPHLVAGAVASSEQTAERLTGYGIEVMDLNMTGDLFRLYRRCR